MEIGPAPWQIAPPIQSAKTAREGAGINRDASPGRTQRATAAMGGSDFARILDQILGKEEESPSVTGGQRNPAPVITGAEVQFNLDRILMQTLFGAPGEQPSPQELVPEPPQAAIQPEAEATTEAGTGNNIK